MRVLRRLLWLTLLTFPPGCASTGELPVPDVRQSTGYTCGAAALQAVLSYYGIESREDRLAAELRATEAEGVPPEALVAAARRRGLGADLRVGLTVEDLREALLKKHPVIVALQAWPSRPVTNYRQIWDEGHYLVVIGMRDNTIVFEDPSLLGSRSTITRDDFIARWHDQNARRSYEQLGLVFSGKSPAPPRAYQPIE